MAPGPRAGGAGPADTGWVPLNGGLQTLGSSNAANLSGRLAVDNDLRTWWQPAEGDASPTLTSRLYAPATIHAVRVAWRDIGLDTNRGVRPGPYRYRVELRDGSAAHGSRCWTAPPATTTCSSTTAKSTPTVASRVRLVVTAWPKGVTPGVAEFTVFGTTVLAKR